MLDIRSDAYLSVLEQVVCDFGSVVARGLMDDREMSRETRESRRLAGDLGGGLEAVHVFSNDLISCLAN